MGEVVGFPATEEEPEGEQIQVWECGCGSTEWWLVRDGSIRCPGCGESIWAIWGWSSENPE